MTINFKTIKMLPASFQSQMCCTLFAAQIFVAVMAQQADSLVVCSQFKMRCDQFIVDLQPVSFDRLAAFLTDTTRFGISLLLHFVEPCIFIWCRAYFLKKMDYFWNISEKIWCKSKKNHVLLANFRNYSYLCNRYNIKSFKKRTIMKRIIQGYTEI